MKWGWPVWLLVAGVAVLGVSAVVGETWIGMVLGVPLLLAGGVGAVVRRGSVTPRR